MTAFKDEVLFTLSHDANIAHFASFDPDLRLRFSTLDVGVESSDRRKTAAAVIDGLLHASSEGSVNVRSFHPDQAPGRAFVQDLRTTEEVLEEVDAMGRVGLYTIVNEAIDVSDGGVSGVISGAVAEFAPDATPRVVETGAVALLPSAMAWSLLGTVYGLLPDDVPDEVVGRLEFSVHPSRVGVRRTKVIHWEHAATASPTDTTRIGPWPNPFSRLLGDKTYGLLVANELGVAVPRTVVLNRRVPVFNFGIPTGTGETWQRTAPAQPTPGAYPTTRGWPDPFRLMTTQDPAGTELPTLLAQDAVRARHSGATSWTPEGQVVVEGLAGEGDYFMLGLAAPEPLPPEVTSDVTDTVANLARSVPGARIEWAHDGTRTWVLQLHYGSPPAEFDAGTPVAGWISYGPEQGIAALVSILADAVASHRGVALTTAVGRTSHISELIRGAGVPFRVSGNDVV